MEPEICPKMLKKLSEKLGAKFPATAHGYSMVKITRLDDAFSVYFEVEASTVECPSLQQKGKKRRKRKGKKKFKQSKSLKTSVTFLKFLFLRIFEQKCSKTHC